MSMSLRVSYRARAKADAEWASAVAAVRRQETDQETNPMTYHDLYREIRALDRAIAPNEIESSSTWGDESSMWADFEADFRAAPMRHGYGPYTARDAVLDSRAPSRLVDYWRRAYALYAERPDAECLSEIYDKLDETIR